MDNNDLKKWLTEQISYLEKTKEQPEKFAWDTEYDLQLSAFRLALERLEPVGPMTLEQLREMDGQPVWITSVKKDGKIPSRWVLYSGKSESRDREDVYVFATTGGIAQGYKGAAYGKTWLVYDYQPAHIDQEAWEPCGETCNKSCWNCDHTVDEFFGDADYCKDCHRYSKWETSVHKFCERCGRPRSEEAWAELEKRLRG